MPLLFETTASRGEIPRDEITDDQMCVIDVFGRMGAAMSIGVTKVETEDDLTKFMSRVRFWEKFCPMANKFEDDVLTPYPIPEDAVRSLMPIHTNVSAVTKTKFVKNIVDVYANVL